MAMFHGVKEVIWLRRLLEEIGQEQMVATPLFYYSKEALGMAWKAVLHGLNKHMLRSAAAAKARVVEVAAVVVKVAAGAVLGAAVEVVAAMGLVVGVGVLVAAVEAAVGEMAVAAVGLALGVLVLEVASVSSSSVGARPSRLSSLVSGFCVGRLGVAARMSFVRVAEGDCYRCVPPDPGIAAAALGASASGTLRGTAPAQALHTFTLDSGASRCFFHDSTTLTPLPTPVPVRLADPSGGGSRCQFLHCPPVSDGSVRLTVRSSPPLVLYELGEYRCPPGCDGHYHHSWRA
ncbi:unnamed protein product [Closterium sp. NIES-53]